MCAKFHDAIASGKLIIEQVAIAESSGEAKFWINDEYDDFSALDEEIGSRGGKSHAVTVQCVTFDSLLRKHGVPYYLKIDIERADKHCLETLSPTDLPKYVSIEAHELDYLLILWKLGYKNFKIIDQMRHNSLFRNFSNENPISRLIKYGYWFADRVNAKLRLQRFAPGGSGPFGEDTPGEWKTLEEVAYNWLHFHRGYRKRGDLNPRSRKDFHAKL